MHMRRVLREPGCRRLRLPALALSPRALSSRPRALFGLRGLGRAEHCTVLAEAASQRCDELVAGLVAQAGTPSVDVLHGLDALSQTLCATLDTMELARNVHPDPDFVAAGQPKP